MAGVDDERRNAAFLAKIEDLVKGHLNDVCDAGQDFDMPPVDGVTIIVSATTIMLASLINGLAHSHTDLALSLADGVCSTLPKLVITAGRTVQ